MEEFLCPFLSYIQTCWQAVASYLLIFIQSPGTVADMEFFTSIRNCGGSRGRGREREGERKKEQERERKTLTETERKGREKKR